MDKLAENEKIQVADQEIEINNQFSEHPCDPELRRFIDKYTDDGETRFQVQYHDDPDCWTVPVLLTSKRSDSLKNDHSISRIRLLLQSKMNKGNCLGENENHNKKPRPAD